jgi:hypothetical protein
MNATVAVRPRRHFHWITAVLLVGAIVTAIALTIAVFAGRNDAPATPAPAPVVHTSGVDTGCVHAGPAMKFC